jgi:GNAT superfamily N-acetyltransferase
MTGRNDFSILLTGTPPAAAREVIAQGLTDFNQQLLGPSQAEPLALLLQAADGTVLGGMWARTSRRWLFVDLLFVPETLRRRGLGRDLLARAETEAMRRGCIGAWLETVSGQARELYERCGYKAFGELADYPPGNTRAFLMKRWS